MTESDVIERIHGPKYARGTTSASSYSFVLEDSNTQEQIIGKALELSPSILRPRTDSERFADLRNRLPQDYRIERKEVSHVESSQGILDRLTLVPYEKSPWVTRWSDDSSRQYYSADLITRARRHKKKRELEERVMWTRRPPILEAPEWNKIGEKELRREIRRVLRTARFLLTKAPEIMGDWRRLLSDVYEACKVGLERNESDEMAIDVLEDVKKILAQKKESREIWKLLSDARKQSISVVSCENDFQKILSTKSELWELFGNDLYLLILGICFDEELDIEESELDALWCAFSDWQFTNMRFVQYDHPSNHVKSKYDISSIWSNLRWRAEQLSKKKPILGVFEKHRFGLLIQVEHSSSWLMLQDKTGPRTMIAGFTKALKWPLRWNWYECVVSPFELEEESSKLWNTSVPFVVTYNEGKEILWTPRMDDDEILLWWAEGIFEYGLPPKGKITPIRWFRLSKIPDNLRKRLVQPEVSVPNELENTARHILKQLDNLSDNIKLVDCIVTLDIDKEVYQVQFSERGVEESKSVCTLEIENTIELIQILRQPKLKGEPFRNEFWWNPESDIEYLQVDTERGPISLTFLRPFIYRSRKGSEFLRNLALPRTARSLLRTTMGDPITLVADPNLEQTNHPYSRYWRILFLQVEPSEKMLCLQNIDMNVIELAQFFESEQFIDTTTGLKHPLKFVINKLNQVNFPKDVLQYDRIATYLDEKGMVVTDENDFEDSVP